MGKAATPAAIDPGRAADVAGRSDFNLNRAALATPVPFHACVQHFLDGTDTPRAYLERCIARIEEHEPSVRAFVHLDLDTARRQADQAGERYRLRQPRSPVDGMPVGIKDIIDTRDMPTQMNSPLFAGFQPRRDAACVIALKRAGAVIVGKTVTTEFACGRSGPTRNPHDSLRTPGGSSSGSAAAVAAGMLPAALGTQTQASIIRPASYCGIVGYKPSIGTLCYDGIGRLAPSLDQLGVLAGDLGDAQAVAAAIAAVGPDYGGSVLTPGAQIGQGAGVPLRRLARLHTEAWPELDPVARDVFEQTMASLAAAGVELIDHDDPLIARIEDRLAHIAVSALHIFAWEAQWPLRSYLDCGAELMGARVQELVQLASEMRPEDYARAVAMRESLRAEVAAMAGTVDAFVTASSSGAAPLGLDNTGSRTFSVPWTLVGGPALSLPVQQSGGLPFGLQLMGLPGRDSELFGFAQWVMTQRKRS